MPRKLWSVVAISFPLQERIQRVLAIRGQRSLGDLCKGPKGLNLSLVTLEELLKPRYPLLLSLLYYVSYQFATALSLDQESL